eukprot:CCRYP_017428-RA/>CCRYP_017428-RA protein AED:0.30 eAED:0.30 QI:0/0/0/1/1/1/2/0/492
MLNYRQLIQHPTLCNEWTLSSANEFGRLAQGMGCRIKGTDTIQFIAKADIPIECRKDITYSQFVCTVPPEKQEPNRTRFTVGGDRINYPSKVATPTADMITAKILFNSDISTPGTRFMTLDISNFYLMIPLKHPEYLRVKLRDIPEEIIHEYNLKSLADPDGSVYILVQLGIKLVRGLWCHKQRPIQFSQVVDDFRIKYTSQEHVNHLLAILKEHYTVTTDWTGTHYIGITLNWDYAKRQVHLSMPGYVAKALKPFDHPKPTTPQHSPFPSTPIKYGTKKQYATLKSTSPPLNKANKHFIQQICGKFLFLGRVVHPTLLSPISTIASQSAQPTEDTMNQTSQLLDYLASQDDAVLMCNASKMILRVHSNASYFSEPNARSRAGGHFFLSTNASVPPNNEAILNIAHIIKHIMASATHAELGVLYITALEAIYLHIILKELGHKIPATPIQTDNAMVEGVINGKVQPKHTKAMDMRFHWLRDCECQDQFRIYW